MTSRRSLLAVTTLLAGFALAACGDDEASSDDTEAAVETDAPSETEAPDDTEAPSETEAPSATEGSSETDAPAATQGSTSGGGDDEFCAAAQPLAEFNASAPALDTSAPFEDLKAEVVATIEGSLGLYADAIAVAPDEIRDQLETLETVNEDFVTAVEDATTQEEVATAINDIATPEVLEATTDLDAYLQEECGFGLTTSTGG